MSLTFSVNGFPLSGVDEYGVKWTVQVASGWHSGPPVRSNRLSKAQQAGSWPSTGHAGERFMVLRGLARTVGSSDGVVSLERAARAFAAVLAHGGMGELVGDSDFGTLTAAVSLADDPRFDVLSGRHAMWELPLAAPDPLLYGPQTFATATLSTATPGAGLTYPLAYPLDYGVAPGTTPGAVTVANDGTAAYWPRLRVDGPVLNPTVSLVESGAWVRFNGSLTAGQWLDFDLANRRVLLQGQVSVRHKVTSSGNWLAVSPGGGSIAWTADTADPAALLSVWAYERAVA